MLITGVVSSRIGAKRTLLVGLSLIIVFSALAGTSDTIGQIVGFRAGWGLGNALFIATASNDHRDVGARHDRRGDHHVRSGARAGHRDRPAARRRARLDQLAGAVHRRFPPRLRVAVVVLAVGRRYVESAHAPAVHSPAEGELVAVGDAG